MHAFACRALGLAILGALAVVLPAAPFPAVAATLATDAQEIPPFVLDHVELTPGVRLPPR